MEFRAIGIAPESYLKSHSELLRVLEEIYPVRFRAYPDEGGTEFDGVVLFDSGAPESPADLPSLRFVEASVAVPTSGTVTFSDSAHLDSIWKNRTVRDDQAGSLHPIEPQPGEVVLAECSGRPIWVAAGESGGGRHRIAGPPPELKDDDCLRDLFRPGRFFQLLPVVHFLSRLTGKLSWSPPPLRAAFLMDDPNLHSTSYGYLDYPRLVAHARDHHYHLASATIPLDAWHVSSAAAQLFRTSGDQISLLVHGNNHVRHELAMPLEQTDRRKLLAQALRRMDQLEKRSGVGVSRVMVAPHGRCSEEMMADMLALGFDGVCISRPYPWLDRPPEGRKLAGWQPSELVAGGLPVLPRLSLSGDPDELLFRAWLGQPLIVYCHHQDLADGLGVFAEMARIINSFGDVEWQSIGSMARANYETRQQDDCLHLRAFSRSLVIPAGRNVSRLRIELPSVHGGSSSGRVEVNGQEHDLETHPVSGAVGSDFLPYDSSRDTEIRFPPPSPVDPYAVTSPTWKPWPVLRRILTETRDRLQPALSGRGRNANRHG